MNVSKVFSLKEIHLERLYVKLHVLYLGLEQKIQFWGEKKSPNEMLFLGFSLKFKLSFQVIITRI